MPDKRLLTVIMLLFASLVAGIHMPQAHAQENLLTNPGFEQESGWQQVAVGTDDGDGNTTFNAPPGWSGWYNPSRSESWENRLPNGFPHMGSGFVRSGGRSMNLDRGDATFTAAIYQTVSVPEGANVVGSAWVRMNLNLDAGPNARARVGIHPGGGTNPFDSSVVWSGWATNTVNAFTQLTASATATGTSVTIFLYATQQYPSNPNGVYWDDASLVVGGEGGSVPGADSDNGEGSDPANTPVPPPPPVASFVQPQPPQDDGSIVHTVQEGHTLFAIAVAYGVPRSDILELNNLSDGRILQVGQRLIIREAGGAGAEAAADDGDSEEPADEPDTDDSTNGDSEAADEPDTDDSTNGDSEAADEPASGDDPASEPADDEDSAQPEPAEPAVPPTAAPPAPVAMASSSDALDPASRVSAVCLFMFEDTNQNRVREAADPPLAGGTISLVRDGETLEAIVTADDGDAYCIEDLEAGDYTAVATAPSGYGLTTPDQLRLRLQTGSTLNVNFGAAAGVEALPPPPSDVEIEDLTEDEPAVDDDDDSSDLLQNIGLIVFALAGVTLVGGLGVSLLLRRS